MALRAIWISVFTLTLVLVVPVESVEVFTMNGFWTFFLAPSVSTLPGPEALVAMVGDLTALVDPVDRAGLEVEFTVTVPNLWHI
jgi:hypothetical protein